MLEDNYLRDFQKRRIAEGVSEAARSREEQNRGFLGELLEVVRYPKILQGHENGDASAAVIFFRQTVLPLISSHTSHLDVDETLRQIGIYLEEDVHHVRKTALY